MSFNALSIHLRKMKNIQNMLCLCVFSGRLAQPHTPHTWLQSWLLLLKVLTVMSASLCKCLSCTSLFFILMAIWLTCRNRIWGAGLTELQRLRVEFMCFYMKHDIVAFGNVWWPINSICIFGVGELTVCTWLWIVQAADVLLLLLFFWFVWFCVCVCKGWFIVRILGETLFLYFLCFKKEYQNSLHRGAAERIILQKPCSSLGKTNSAKKHSSCSLVYDLI